MVKTAKDNNKELVKKEIAKINANAKIEEAYFVALLWSDPLNNYGEYADKIEKHEFIHDVWGFYFELGKQMFKKSIKVFDEISVHQQIKDLNLKDEYEKHGGSETIDDAIDIVESHSENTEHYYEIIKKNYVIRQLFALFGDKVLLNKNKYDWKKMNREQLSIFWNDKVNQVSLGNVSNYEAENLYISPKEFIRRLKEDSAEMLPFYGSKLMNSISQGIPRGHVTMIGGYGGTGKSSITVEKVLMSNIANGEKTIVVLNEEDAQALRQKVALTIMSHEFSTSIDRKHLITGELTPEEEDKITEAFEKMHDLMNEDDGLIKVIFMEKYVMKDMENIIRFWANRGYNNLIVDTHKVSDESTYDKRWEIFVEDMKSIYRLTRKNAGGLNLRTVVTFQLSDTSIRNRYLDFEAIGEGKASKNEASIMYMFRSVWGDEYADGKNELKCYRNQKIDGKFQKVEFTLEEGKTYYLWFTPKNRFGSSNDTGQAVLVLEPLFYANTFKEIGWAFVTNEKGSRR